MWKHRCICLGRRKNSGRDPYPSRSSLSRPPRFRGGRHDARWKADGSGGCARDAARRSSRTQRFFRLLAQPEKAGLNVKFISRAGRTYSFTKWVAVVSSQESKSPASDAEQIVDAAEEEGYVRVLRTHENAWAQLWQPDIRIQGDVEAERAIHAAMYYLFSSLRRDDDRSLPAMALPSRAYLGRVWWDADTWILPSLLVLHPDLARSIVAYRCHTLSEARLNARRLGY